MTSATPITITQAERLLDRYGADLNKWPRDEATAFSALVKVSASAQHIWNRAQTLESTLMAQPIPVPAPELRMRILNAVKVQDQAAAEPITERANRALDNLITPLLDWLSRALWRPALIACLPLALGYVFGAAIELSNEVEFVSDTADYLTLLSWQDPIEELSADEF